MLLVGWRPVKQERKGKGCQHFCRISSLEVDPVSLGSCGDRRRADAEYSGISLFEMLQRLARLVVVSAVSLWMHL